MTAFVFNANGTGASLRVLPPVSRLFLMTSTKLVPDSHITTLMLQFPL